MEMRTYALEQASALLGRLVFRANRVIKLPDPDAIHDLRVAIRRLDQCLRLFGQFFPRPESKKIRRRLGRIRDAAGEVRDRDIVLKILADAGAPANRGLVATMQQERKKVQEPLIARLERFRKGDSSRKWRKRLNL